MSSILFALFAAALALACSSPSAMAQAYPAKPIRLVVGFTPGGGVDINARLLGPKITEFLGQAVIVENRSGAGTNIANELVANIPAISAHVKSGRLRPIANLGPRRSDQLPQVPTMTEAGVKGVEVVVWYGVFAPAATPRAVVDKLAETIARAARAPDIRQKLQDLGAEPVGNTSEEFSKLFLEEVARWAEVVRISGARAD